MQSQLADYLIEIASDAPSASRFVADPVRAVRDAGLSGEAAAAVLSGAGERIDRVVAEELGPLRRKARRARVARPGGSLTVAGLGIMLVRDVTLDALDAIRRADRVFFLVPTPGIAAWLYRQNPHLESVADAYDLRRPRGETYQEIAGRVVSAVRAGDRVCFAVGGHPGVGVYASHAAIRQARREGYEARMIPGVSAEATLIADLGIDPVDLGWQSYEGTSFVEGHCTIDTSAGLALWQVGVVGITTAWPSNEPHVAGLQRLARVLGQAYPPGHEVVVYQAATYPVCAPRIAPVAIEDLPGAAVTPSTTLFLPPCRPRTLRTE